MARALLSLGSNIEPKKKYLAEALEALDSQKDGTRLIKVSRLYESAAVDVTDQADFLNLAAEIETKLTPEALLLRLKKIEKDAGKNIVRRRGPRTLDLDLLLFGSEIRQSSDLILPHERMHQRAFVLEPLAEIAAEQMHPVLKKKVIQLLKGLSRQKNIVCLGALDTYKE